MWEPIVAGSGSAGAGSMSHGAHRDRMNGYPIQLAKIQSPALREETLARDRLLDWLAAKVHQRVVLVLADAGYGKTTLLADFSRRTRLRTLWYRLDEDDRDWISFLSHLIAAGREHDPEFAPTSAAMLGDLAMGGPTREAATDVFLRELPAIAEHGAILILDDFHLVDESPDIRLIVRDLVARAPERLSIIFASRRMPSIPLARMRASGEVAEIGTDDLRFDAGETARLFSETYGRELEPDVLADVAARTEGWAASLQLVQAALRDRSPAEIRRFVRSLTGADQELYDYLAEEVVGDLPDDLQQFLMRTSILQIVSADLAGVATGLDADEVARLSGAAERLTLLTRPSRTSRLAPALPPSRPRIPGGASASHDLGRCSRRTPPSSRRCGRRKRLASRRLPLPPGRRPVRRRHDHRRSDPRDHGQRPTPDRQRRDRPRATGGPAPSPEPRHITDPDAASANTSRHWPTHRRSWRASILARRLATTRFMNLTTLHSYRLVSSIRPVRSPSASATTTSSEQLRLIADGTGLLLDAVSDGSVEAFSRHLRAMGDRQRGKHAHYFGVTMLNLAVNSVAHDQPDVALTLANDAIEALEETSSAIELSAALMAKAYALTFLGRTKESQAAVAEAKLADVTEASYEEADIADSFRRP